MEMWLALQMLERKMGYRPLIEGFPTLGFRDYSMYVSRIEDSSFRLKFNCLNNTYYKNDINLVANLTLSPSSPTRYQTAELDF